MGAIIAAIIAAGGALLTTALTNQAIEDSNQQGLKLANIQRQDELRLQEENRKLSRAQLRLQKKQLGYEREAELFGRKERAEERGYQRRQQAFSNQINILNRNDAMRDQLVSIWRR